MIKQLLISTRFGNLLMIALFLWLSLNHEVKNASNNWYEFYYYIISVLLIAFSGYVINDYYDRKIDAINRPGKNLFEIAFFEKLGIKVYTLLNLSALLLMLVRPMHILFLGVFIALLFAYARFAKGMPLIGNVIVAFCMSFTIYPLYSMGIGRSAVIFVYIAFAFLLSMAREMVKDLEDIEGDKSQRLKTAAIIFPLSMNKAMIISFLFCLVAGLGYLIALIVIGAQLNLSSVSIYYLLFLMLPISIKAIYMAATAKEKEHWTKLSNWLKMIMLAGILSLAII